jgi:heme/copper-type cytochrome/quinol oxidase subunit 2
MSKNKIIILIVVIAIIVAIFVWGFLKNKSQTSQNNGVSNTVNQSAPQSQTWQAPPKNVEVPGVGETNVPEGIAVPKNVSPASAVSDAKIRNFSELKIENNKFTPQEFIVKQGDVFDVNITAIDKNYDIYQPDDGSSLVIKKGETKRWQFQPTAVGKFTFYCKSCGGPEKGPVGYLVVVPK